VILWTFLASPEVTLGVWLPMVVLSGAWWAGLKG